MSLFDVVRSYIAANLCVLPAIRAEKRPAVGQWKQYQKQLPTESELSAWLSNDPNAICIVCGKVSGHLEAIDFDGGGELFESWRKRVPNDLLNKLVIECTPSGGFHVIYRCKVIVSGNLKLAQREHDDGVRTLIETRGEGGLFLCAPTDGYAMVQGDLCNLPTLTEFERELLLQAAWELNENEAKGQRLKAEGLRYEARNAHPLAFSLKSSASHLPGDDFNCLGDVRSVLEQFGWSCVRGGENEYWRRPGKDSGMSATLKDRVFYVFSSNAAPFEPNRGYSPFAVYTLLKHGGDFEQAARSLGESGFGGDSLTDTDDSADISAIVRQTNEMCEHNAPLGQRMAMCDAESAQVAEIPDPGPMSVEMLRVPGFINEVMDHCLDTAPYPNPVMAFSGALSLLAFLTGRKVRDPGDNRTNIYLLGLAHSAAGKDWPRKLNTRIVHEAGLSDSLGERFASGEGIQDALLQTPAMLFQTDEIDGMLQSINKSKDARHEAIMNTLLTMFSSANSVYPMRRKAGKESGGVIDQPHLVIFGTAIPNHYYEALSERMLTNGFFARMIILESGARGTGQEPTLRDPPTRVLETAKWWANYRPGDGNLSEWHPRPTVVEHSSDAKRLLIDTRLEAEDEYAKAEANGDAVGTTVWGRVSEQVRKLALLYAVSENHKTPTIGLSAVKWASAFVMHQTRRMLFMASSHVADNDFDALINRAVAILRGWCEKHGRDALMPAWELRRRLKQRPSDFKDIVFELTERRIATFGTEPGKTKPKSGYQLL